MDADMKNAYHHLRAQSFVVPSNAQSFVVHSNATTTTTVAMETTSQEYSDGREARTSRFLQHLQQKRIDYFLDLLVEST